MNAGSCCHAKLALHCSRASMNRNLNAAGWLVPAAILALIPKCPLCIAMYLAVGLGVGVSSSTATYLRVGLIVLCVALLAYFGARQAVSLRRRKHA